MSTWGVEKRTGFAIQNVELQKIVRQVVVKNGMFCVHPFAVHYISGTEYVVKRLLMNARPLLEQIVMPFAIPAGQIMPAALEQQIAVGVKRNGGIGAVAFLFNRQRLAGNFRKRNL